MGDMTRTTTLEVTTETYDVGVVIGRFQVSELHEGHAALIQSVVDRHRKVVILLGQAPLPNSRSNPLDFESRTQMIKGMFPNVIVLYVNDSPSDEVWSKNVDRTIRDVTGANQSVVLYGSRDNFSGSYSGKFPTLELISSYEVSGTEHRAEVAREARDSADWRAGVIWASQSRYPTCYTAVDVAIFNEDYSAILLGRKPDQTQFQLIGGFSDPLSPTFEADASREAYEEAHVVVQDLEYVTSRIVEDWRYRKEPDCIKTLLFTCRTLDIGEADDDIVEVKWFPLSDMDPQFMSAVRSFHMPLVTAAINSIKRKGLIK